MENSLLENIYYNPKHPASYGGINKLYQYAKLVNPDLKLNEVKEWLSYQTSYTLHRKARRRFTRNKIYVSYIDEQWECDLVDMRKYSRQNKGFKYILTCVDCFSKFVFARPTKTKDAFEMIMKFKKIFKERKPDKIRTDRGLEFVNELFKAFCKENNVRHFTTQDKYLKCSMVERVNQTLKNKMYEYFDRNGTRQYINYLDDCVESYNNSIHNTTKMAPIDVDESDEEIVFENIYNAKNLKEIFFNNQKLSNLNVGDNVRMRYELTSMDKSYYPLWTHQIFKIHKVFNKINKPQYVIKIGDELITRRFYPEELQKVKVDENSLYGIEKIIKRRKYQGEDQILVKWLNYPSKFNLWIPATHVKRL